MNRSDCNALVEKIYLQWRIEGTIQDRKKAPEIWWEFLHDLDLDAVRRVLNLRAMANGYPPRPGEVRAEVILGRIPHVAEIWRELQAASAKVNSGQFLDEPYSKWTGLVVKKLGSLSFKLETNGDRNMVAEVLREVVKDELDACQPPPPPN